MAANSIFSGLSQKDQRNVLKRQGLTLGANGQLYATQAPTHGDWTYDKEMSVWYNKNPNGVINVVHKQIPTIGVGPASGLTIGGGNSPRLTPALANPPRPAPAPVQPSGPGQAMPQFGFPPQQPPANGGGMMYPQIGDGRGNYGSPYGPGQPSMGGQPPMPMQPPINYGSGYGAQPPVSWGTPFGFNANNTPTQPNYIPPMQMVNTNQQAGPMFGQNNPSGSPQPFWYRGR